MSPFNIELAWSFGHKLALHASPSDPILCPKRPGTRAKGELTLLNDPPNAAAVGDDYFQQSLDWARRQGALTWELRTATSLARLWSRQGRYGDRGPRPAACR